MWRCTSGPRWRNTATIQMLPRNQQPAAASISGPTRLRGRRTQSTDPQPASTTPTAGSAMPSSRSDIGSTGQGPKGGRGQVALGDEAASPAGTQPRPVRGGTAAGGEHHDGVDGFTAHDRLADCEAVDVRQRDIQQDDVGPQPVRGG